MISACVTVSYVGYVTCLLCNVALHRPTTSTSMYSYNNTLDGNACNAVDGWNTTNFFSGSCYHSHKDDPHPSVTVDLGDIYDIQNVGFALREDNLQFEHYTKLSNFKIYVGNETNNPSEVCAVYPGVPTNDDIGKGILVSCSALARYVTVTKLSEDLQFCEMNVIGRPFYTFGPVFEKLDLYNSVFGFGIKKISEDENLVLYFWFAEADKIRLDIYSGAKPSFALYITNIPSSFSCPEPPQSWYCRDLCLDVDGGNTCTQNFSIESTTNEVSLKPTTIMDSMEVSLKPTTIMDSMEVSLKPTTIMDSMEVSLKPTTIMDSMEVSLKPTTIMDSMEVSLKPTTIMDSMEVSLKPTTIMDSMEVSLKPTTIMDSSETTINIVSSIQTTDETFPESTFPEISQELVTIEVSAVNTEVSAIPPEVSAITTEMLAVTPEVSTVTIGVSAVTTEASTVTTEASAITTEASTETTKISAVTTEVSAITTEASAITTEVSAETTEASAITTEVSPVTTGVSAETTTNEMYLEVTTMVTQTGDVTRDAIITQSTMYAQNTSTRCVCPCLQEKSELELTNYVNMLIDQIKIDVKETVIAKSRRTSAPDNRRSAKAIGFVGIIVIVLPVLFFVVFDVVSFIKFHSGK